MGLNNPSVSAGAMVLIEAKNMDAGAAASFDFTGVANYPHYVLKFSGISSADSKTLVMRFNNDGGANYNNSLITQTGATITGSSAATAAYATISAGAFNANPANTFCSAEIQIDNGIVSKTKPWLSHWGFGVSWAAFANGSWANTADAISRITIFTADASNIGQYSRCSLYGVQ